MDRCEHEYLLPVLVQCSDVQTHRRKRANGFLRGSVNRRDVGRADRVGGVRMVAGLSYLAPTTALPRHAAASVPVIPTEQAGLRPASESRNLVNKAVRAFTPTVDYSYWVSGVRIISPHQSTSSRGAPHPEARVPHLGRTPRRIARVSKDSHKRDGASGHPSRRRTASRLQPTCVLDVPISGKPEIGAPPQDEVWG